VAFAEENAVELHFDWGNVIRGISVSLLVFQLVSSARAEPPVAIQGGYSTKPLEHAVFDPAQVAVEVATFNNWLNSNYSTLNVDRMKGPREHLYYLIDSRVKSIYARDQVVFPPQQDLVLRTLFLWSERLGAYGGNLVFNALPSEDLPRVGTLMPVPPGFELALRGDMLSLSSNAGRWSVAVPYYFMLWHVAEFEAKAGPKTQIATFSTGAAAHEGQPGHSQASLMLLFGPGDDGESFVRYWASQLGFSGEEREEAIPGRSAGTRRLFDASRNMHREYATWRSPHGQFVVAYLGLNGTYQWNRPHFLDFLGAIREE
jgi:hypothetical protein